MDYLKKKKTQVKNLCGCKIMIAANQSELKRYIK